MKAPISMWLLELLLVTMLCGVRVASTSAWDDPRAGCPTADNHPPVYGGNLVVVL
jgi:hypothetical protein